MKIQYLNCPFDLFDLPPNFFEFVRAMSKLLDNQTIKRDTGLPKSNFDKKIRPILDKFTTNSNDRVALEGHLTKEDMKILQCLIFYIIVRPAFNSDRLISDFIAVLQSNSLIKKNEVERFLRFAPGIVIHTVSCMHLCQVVLSDSSKSNLYVQTDGSPPSLIVASMAEVISHDLKNLHIAFPVFATTLPFIDYVSNDMKEEPFPWRFPVQLATGKISLEKL